jgi:hypothetical protein
MQEIDLATQTMFAELLQRSLDAEFRENGTFVRKRSKGRLYWHYQWRAAWQSGQRWRKKLEAGRARLPGETQASLLATLESIPG